MLRAVERVCSVAKRPHGVLTLAPDAAKMSSTVKASLHCKPDPVIGIATVYRVLSGHVSGLTLGRGTGHTVDYPLVLVPGLVAPATLIPKTEVLTSEQMLEQI